MLLSDLLYTAIALASTVLARNADPGCYDYRKDNITYPCANSATSNGIMILAARGTDADFVGSSCGKNDDFDKTQEGLANIAGSVIRQVPGSYFRSLPYAACAICGREPGLLLGFELNYKSSVAGGAVLGQRIIEDYVAKCTRSGFRTPRVLLLGYSQGAQVMTSVLTGDTLPQGNLQSGAFPPINVPKKNIAGGVFIASSSHRDDSSNLKFTVNRNSTDTRPAIYPRTLSDYQAFDRNWGSIVRNYCQANDSVCDSGATDEGRNNYYIPPGSSQHATAVATFTQQAIDFLASLRLNINVA